MPCRNLRALVLPKLRGWMPRSTLFFDGKRSLCLGSDGPTSTNQGAILFALIFLPDLSGASAGIPSIHGSADGGAGLVGLLDTVLNALSKAFDSGGGFEWLPGIGVLGLNIHPGLVHFPIAFLTVFFLLEMLGMFIPGGRLRQTASAMLYCGTLGALLAAAAGLYAANTVPHGAEVHDIMEWHERFGLAVAGLALGFSAWRYWARPAVQGMERALLSALSIIMMAGLVFGADLGGLMVYGHGVAVHALQEADAHHHHQDGGGATEP